MTPGGPGGPVPGGEGPVTLLCPVNISEGRRLDVVAAVAQAAVDGGALLLDVHCDPDHNRSVLSFAGEPSRLVDGLIAASRIARALIDLGQHQGCHPRMGAVDVVPFVPLWPTGLPGPGMGAEASRSMAQAHAAAQEFARRAWSELAIPSLFYGQAAPAGSHRELPELRRRGLRDLPPDVGQGAHRTAGIIAVGARRMLVAFNVDLDSDDLEAARSIARSIRQSDGGLLHVRALGLLLASRGRAQVSMNLLQPMITSVGAAFEAVESAARERSVTIAGSEIVGLVPRAALPASLARLRLTQPAKVLEEELARYLG